MTEFIAKMGPLAWVFGVLIVYALGIIAERLLYFHRVRIGTGDFLRGLSMLIRNGEFKEAAHEASKLPGPIARVVESVMSRPTLPSDDLREIAREASQLETYKIEKNIRGLLVVATISPLVGALGGILSLVRFYSQPGVFEGKTSSPFILSDAIYQALLTSAAGLAVAIPAYLFYSYLAARARLICHEVSRSGMESVYLISDAREKGNGASGVEVESTPKQS